MNDFSLITSGATASLVLELVKMLVRSLKPGYDFPVKFYVFALPLVTFAVQPLLAWLGVPSLTMPSDWVLWAKSLVLVGMSSAISLLVYDGGISPFKEFIKERLG